MKSALGGAVKALGYSVLRSKQEDAIEKFVPGRIFASWLREESLYFACLPLVYDNSVHALKPVIADSVDPRKPSTVTRPLVWSGDKTRGEAER